MADEKVTLSPLEQEALALKRQIARLGRPLRPEESLWVREKFASIRERLARQMMDRLIANRPEVISHGRPVAGDTMKRGLEEARARLRARTSAPNACSSCPAATSFRRPTGVVAVRCAIERTLLDSVSDPQSLLSFCFGDYRDCPTWQAEREREWAAKPVLVGAHEGV